MLRDTLFIFTLPILSGRKQNIKAHRRAPKFDRSFQPVSDDPASSVLLCSIRAESSSRSLRASVSFFCDLRFAISHRLSAIGTAAYAICDCEQSEPSSLSIGYNDLNPGFVQGGNKARRGHSIRDENIDLVKRDYVRED